MPLAIDVLARLLHQFCTVAVYGEQGYENFEKADAAFAKGSIEDF